MKKILLGVGLLLCTGIAKAQDYYQGIGAQVNYGIFSLSYSDTYQNYSGTTGAAVPGIFYKASLAFDISRSTNFAISSYPFVGLNANFNSMSGASGSFGAELPILGEIYFGDLDDPCFFMGAGFSAAYLASSDVWGGASAGPILGPQVDIGGQFEFQGRMVGLRAAYTYGLNNTRNVASDVNITKDTRWMLGLGAYYVLGQ